MCDSIKVIENNYVSPQCQYFVLRKKRLCRMTVKPGKNYCGEHEPQPKTDAIQGDTRIPCPNDPKHTCYAKKLEKHLKICNGRQQEQPDYIIYNINAPKHTEEFPRLPLAKIPLHRILNVIQKVNVLYDRFLKDTITTVPEQPIHSVVLQEFNETGRTESSLRHLRQASSLLHLIESEELVKDNTCYVELGAGKGHLSYYAWWAWCQGTNSRVLLIDRASLRHKRDNKLRDTSNSADDELTAADDDPKQKTAASSVLRVRADLAHMVLNRAPGVASGAVVGLAKHLCGVATDYALRCLTSSGAEGSVRGAALATCCQHRCEGNAYPAARHLQELGINGDDFNTLLGVVSWATCGSGRSRTAVNAGTDGTVQNIDNPRTNSEILEHVDSKEDSITLNINTKENSEQINKEICDDNMAQTVTPELGTKNLNLTRQQREEIGRRAKVLIDWGRVLYLQEHGFDARLVHYVPTSVSLENICIVARKVS